MRFLLSSVCLAALWFGLSAPQKTTGQAAPSFEPPSVVSSVDVVYPLNSVSSGTVVLEAVLDAEGKVTDVHVVRGIPSLTQPAIDSLRQWKFRPALLGGQPMPSKMDVAFSFVPPNYGPRV